MVSMGGIEPPSRAYESLVLTIELHRRENTIIRKRAMLNALPSSGRVAGIRFARMPTGYEPVEVLLLQPAI